MLKLSENLLLIYNFSVGVLAFLTRDDNWSGFNKTCSDPLPIRGWFDSVLIRFDLDLIF